MTDPQPENGESDQGIDINDVKMQEIREGDRGGYETREGRHDR